MNSSNSSPTHFNISRLISLAMVNKYRFFVVRSEWLGTQKVGYMQDKNLGEVWVIKFQVNEGFMASLRRRWLEMVFL